MIGLTALTPAQNASAADDAPLSDNAVILIPANTTAQEIAAADRLRDPYCDYDQEMKDFLQYYYGAFAEPIYKFIEIITKNAEMNEETFDEL